LHLVYGLRLKGIHVNSHNFTRIIEGLELEEHLRT